MIIIASLHTQSEEEARVAVAARLESRVALRECYGGNIKFLEASNLLIT